MKYTTYLGVKIPEMGKGSGVRSGATRKAYTILHDRHAQEDSPSLARHIVRLHYTLVSRFNSPRSLGPNGEHRSIGSQCRSEPAAAAALENSLKNPSPIISRALHSLDLRLETISRPVLNEKASPTKLGTTRTLMLAHQNGENVS